MKRLSLSAWDRAFPLPIQSMLSLRATGDPIWGGLFIGSFGALYRHPGREGRIQPERVLRAPHAGTVRLVKSIGDPANIGDVILYVDATPVRAAIDGIMRGIIREIRVEENGKVGDIEPTTDSSCCWTISDKARTIGDGVLEAVRNLISIRETYISREEGVRQWMLNAQYARSREILV